MEMTCNLERGLNSLQMSRISEPALARLQMHRFKDLLEPTLARPMHGSQYLRLQTWEEAPTLGPSPPNYQNVLGVGL